MEEVKQEDVHQLLEHFSKCLYKAKEADSKSQDVMQRCLKLVTLDYSHVVISNIGGELSANYPSHLIILEYERTSANVSGNPRPSEPPRTTGTIYENMHDATKLRELFGKSRFARCRARFPLPVILYRGKHICRSSTLSGGPEIYGRSGLDYLFSVTETSAEDEDEEVMGAVQTQKDWQLFDRVRSQDIRLLKTLNVGTIIDFMVEKKKVKFGMNTFLRELRQVAVDWMSGIFLVRGIGHFSPCYRVESGQPPIHVTSSEKVDKENRYSDFTIVSLPYPGCEFFKEYRDNDYVAKGLVFDWTQSHVDAVIGVPDDAVSSQLKIDWEKYKVWDLVKLTQNYMKLLLRYLQENSTGLLIHCISGWDRTPLFISLLRLSLWADGAVHQSLDANQILYFTIAYDWMLFGHNLMDRLSKGEDIFFFCFYFLKHLVGDEYSVAPRSKSKQNVGGGGSSSAAAVLRNDSDLHLDGMLFDADCAISSRGSNISLNSSCSSVSSKSQENPPVLFHNVPDLSDEHTNGNLPIYNPQTTWPPHLQPSGFESALPGLGSLSNQGGSGSGPRSPHPSRTSPVAVPVASRFRQRNDSNSSLSVGSWQLISGTGSLRGSASASTSTGDSATPNSLLSQNSSNTSLCEGQISTESSTTIVEDECFIYNSGPADTTTLRRERLQTVRTLFYNAYCSTVGFKFKNGQDSGLGSLLGNFAEKVGIISTQRTSV